jgi:hypothetical protein
VVRVKPAHGLDVLFGHFKGGAFETNAAGFGVKDEGQVYVEKRPVGFDHYVGVVSVLDL